MAQAWIRYGRRPVQRLLRFGVGLLLVTLALQRDWLRINWDQVQSDIGLTRLLDPNNKLFKLSSDDSLLPR